MAKPKKRRSPRRRSAGLGGIASSPGSLYKQVKACGSHYFDPGTRRFFNSAVIETYPAHKQDATYFVERLGGEKQGGFSTIPRMCRVGVFKGCKVTILGKGAAPHESGKTYKSAQAAKKVARRIAQAIEWRRSRR